MAEIGYRYTELFFAVQDRNWDYADYQLGKIEAVEPQHHRVGSLVLRDSEHARLNRNGCARSRSG
jgi:hypothetical protein